MYDNLDWSHRRDHLERHGVTAEQADEAVNDPQRVVIDPDPRSKTGESVRVIGYSYTMQAVLAVVVVRHDGTDYGGTAWKANKKELALYQGQ